MTSPADMLTCVAHDIPGYRLAVFFIMLLSFVGAVPFGFCACNRGDSNIKEGDCEKLRQVAIQALLEKPDMLANALLLKERPDIVDDIMVKCISVDVMPDLLFYVVVDPTSKPGRDILVSVSLDGQYAFLNEDIFRDFVSQSKSAVKTEEDAFEVALLYVRLFGIPIPRAYEALRILQSYRDIDYVSDPDDHPELRQMIKRPVSKADSSGYHVEFFSWTPVGGDVVLWKFDIAPDLQLGIEKTVVRPHFGKHYLPE